MERSDGPMGPSVALCPIKSGESYRRLDSTRVVSRKAQRKSAIGLSRAIRVTLNRLFVTEWSDNRRELTFKSLVCGAN